MALEVGTVSGRTGLAGAIADKTEALAGTRNFDEVLSAPGIEALAGAIIEYIVANAEITVPNGTSGGDTLTGTVG